MKHTHIILTTLVLFCLVKKTIAQTTTDVVTLWAEPFALSFNENDLYIALFYQNSISKVDITETPSTETNVLGGLNRPSALALNGNYLYIAEQSEGKVSKIDITETTPTAIDVITGLIIPMALAFNGNDLYIAESTAGKISKIDITETTPTIVEVVSGLSLPMGLAFHGNYLYIAEQAGSKVSKIDITETTPTTIDVITGLIVRALAFNGNDLYMLSLASDKISKIDITETAPTIVDVVTGLSSPRAFAFKENNLYIAQGSNFNGKISKFDLNTLSTESSFFNKTIILHPNPSSNFIQITNLNSKKSYKIFDILGVEIKKGIISNNDQIDIRNFTNGLYLLKFDNGNIIKFLKE